MDRFSVVSMNGACDQQNGCIVRKTLKWCQHQWERKTLRGEFFSDGMQMFGHNRITDQWLHSRSSNKKIKTWLVVYLPLWKIWVRQWEGLSHISWKIKHVPNHQPDILVFTPTNKTNQPELGFVGAILQLNHFFTQTHFSRAVHPHLLAFDLPLEPFSRGQRHLLRLGPRGPRGDYPLVAWR